MPRIAYTKKNFSDTSLSIIRYAVAICDEYAAQGYDLTLRQLYYQFVARDLIANRQSEYKRLGSIVNDARLTGYLDWDYIVDRTRNLAKPAAWDSPSQIVQAAADSYHIDRWEGQPYRPEVWVEKDALGGVIERATAHHRVPWFSCRGYTSQSEMWGAAQRFRGYLQDGQVPVILHLGDHDPSGIDMTRDITKRLRDFLLQDWLNNEMPGVATAKPSEIRESMAERTGAETRELPLSVRRIALNMDQIDEYDPPPNPTKVTDSRAPEYIENYGHESWELDALEPTVLNALIRDEVEELVEGGLWDETVRRETEERDRLQEIAAGLDGGEEE